jgi:uncharacterized protein (TIGR03067 family)
MRTSTLFLAAVILSLGFAPAPFPKPRKPDPGRDDPKRIQGTWEMVSRTHGGQPVSHVVATAEIGAGRLTLVNRDGTWRSPFTLTLDPARKPRWFDTKSDNGNYTTSGIYDLKGDTLRLHYTPNGGARPTGFDATQPGVTVDVYRRRKP